MLSNAENTEQELQLPKTPAHPGNGSLLGLVAGEGKLPAILARSAAAKGYKVVAFCLSPEAENRVQDHCVKTFQIAPGQLGRNANLMKAEGIPFLVFIGKVPKLEILKNLTRFDWTAVRELSKLTDFNDDTIQRAMGDFVERNGIRVRTQSEFLTELFPDFGVLTERKPSTAEYADIEFGRRVAKEIARLDIGQTVVVRNQMIMAIEAIEGTDRAIQRAVQLAKGPVVVVKVAKKGHDERFDIPAVGMNTLKAMIAPKPGGVLAVGAHETMIVEREEMLAFCKENEMSMVAI